MNNQATPSGSTPAQPAPPTGSPKATTRNIVTVVVILITIAALAIAIPWVRYRFNNVVLREAAVRGSVTKIGGRIDGRILSVDVEPGQRVTKGQVLLRLEDTHLQAALEKSRGELESATRELQSEKLGITQSRRRLNLEISRASAGIKKAKAELEGQKSTLVKLEKQFERINSLVKTGAAATAELDKITGDRDRALSQVTAAVGVLEAAESNHERTVSDLDGLQVRENHLGVLEAQINVGRAKVTSAESDLESAVVKAPEDGRVIERIVNIGGSAKVGEPMISLWIGKAWVEAWADERDLHKIQPGSLVDISFDAAPDRKLIGRVESIGLITDKHLSPSVVPSTLHALIRPSAMIPIRIALEDENPPVQLGLSVLVGIRKGSDNSEVVSASPWSPKNKTTTNTTISKL